MPRLVFTGGRFYFLTDFEGRGIPRTAGFFFDSGSKKWMTDDVRVAARLREYADDSAKKKLNRSLISHTPWTGPLPFPKNQTPRPFQIDVAVPYALARNRSYLALDPGLGKTVCAAIVMNALAAPTVYICPPFLTRNVEAEFEKWITYGPLVMRLEGKTIGKARGKVLIVPDSIIHRPEVQKKISLFTAFSRSKNLSPLLVVDEAHRYKNETALRTKALFGSKQRKWGGIRRLFDREVYMSGTPMPNRPMELYPVLKNVAPEVIDFADRFKYGLKYCGAYQDENGYWDFDGESNFDELQAKMKATFMLRLKKIDVLPELPPKTETFVFIGDKLPPRVAALEGKLLREFSPEDLMAGRINTSNTSTYRRELGGLKIKPAAEYIRSLLSESNESLLVFAYHREVMEQLAIRLAEFDPFVIMGGVSSEKRREIELEFQSNKKRRLFLGNYGAAGIGITLTKATRVIFVEFDWVPAVNDQASDRAHRIGQKDHVLVEFLVFKNSIDRKVMEVNFRKKKITNQL